MTPLHGARQILIIQNGVGSGKTTICEKFEKAGYDILDEAFLDIADYSLHPQSLLMETTWVCAWFERVLKLSQKRKQQNIGTQPEQILITDRSPFSAVFYANHGHLLEAIIRQHIKEVQAATDVKIYTIHVQVERELLWSRIKKRLERNPFRVEFNEHKREWMDKCLDFYDSFTWDMTIQNNGQNDIDQVCAQVLEKIQHNQEIHLEAISESNDTSFDETDSSDTELDLSSTSAI